MSERLISIDFEEGGAPFHCPVCGTQLVVPDEELRSCPHLLFAWIDVVGDFEEELTRPEIRTLAESLDEDEVGVSPYEDAFLNKLPRNSLAFALTEHGIACGPVSTTLVVGVQFPQ